MINNSLKRSFLFLSFIFAFVSLFTNVLSYTENMIFISMKGFNIFSFVGVVVTSLILLIFKNLRNNNFNLYFLISLVHLMFGFISLFIVFILYNPNAYGDYSLGIGYYLSLISYVSFIVYFYVLKNEKSKSGISKLISDELENELHLISFHVVGFNKLPYDKLILIRNFINEKNITLSYIVNYDEEKVDLKDSNDLEFFDVVYSYDEIEDISYESDVTVGTRLSVNKSIAANLLFSHSVMSANPVGITLSMGMKDNSTNDTIATFDMVYEVTILMKSGDKFLFKTYDNPDKFINTIKY